MPMRTESSTSAPRSFTVARTGAASSVATLPNGRHRTQTGFRSGPLTQEEARAIKARPSNRASMLSHIAILEEESRDVPRFGYPTRNNSVWPVNDRDYTETRYKPTGFNLKLDYRAYPYTSKNMYSCQGAFGVSELLSGHMPAMPGSSTLSSMAAQLLRNTRPPQIGFDLARFALEQREAPLLFKASNYMPRNKKELGGAYLNFLFGLKPTGSDLGKLAETVIASDRAISEFLAHEKVVEKKYGTRVILKDSNSGEQILQQFETSNYSTDFWTGLHKTRVWIPAAFGSSGSYGTVLWPVFRWTYTRKQLLRTFATWEYFIPRPLEFEGRLASYRKGAAELLSMTKVNESTVYELTPWTWLANWFVDFGGLLRYQREVVDNQMVMSSSGYSTWEEYTGLTSYSGLNPSPQNGLYPYLKGTVEQFTGVQSSIQWRRHSRRKGNPYSLSPTWSFSTQQWAILGALGLSRGLDVRHNRV